MKNGKFHGMGKYTFASGNVYHGTWSKNKMDGKGILKYSNGDCYQGSFVMDMKTGYGKYEYGEGHVYTGEFLNEKKDGDLFLSYRALYENVMLWILYRSWEVRLRRGTCLRWRMER